MTQFLFCVKIKKRRILGAIGMGVIIMAMFDVLKFESTADIFAWKHPNSELNTWSQLIVNESQEAVLLCNGRTADVFGPGHHTLSTDNIPILRSLINIPFGGKSPFSAEVWFINKAFSLDVKWGTTSPIQIQDPRYKVFVPVRAFGQYGIRVVDSRRFLMKLVGTMRFFNKDTLTNYFRGHYVTRVKDAISSSLVNTGISVLEINAHLNELSETMKKQLSEDLADYGIEVVTFFVNDISVPENDPTVKQLKAALAKRAEMEIIGYNYQQERTFNTMENAASNSGTAGAVMGAGMGLGMGFNMGGYMGDQMQRAMDDKKCPDCGAKMVAGQKFCPTCGCNTEQAAKKDASVKCSACGKLLEKGAKFCPECGRRLKVCAACGADIPDGQTTCPGCGGMVCPGCGKIMAAGSKFCAECGYSAVKKCPECGKTVDGKFCPQCGTRIPE